MVKRVSACVWAMVGVVFLQALVWGAILDDPSLLTGRSPSVGKDLAAFRFLDGDDRTLWLNHTLTHPDVMTLRQRFQGDSFLPNLQDAIVAERSHPGVAEANTHLVFIPFQSTTGKLIGGIMTRFQAGGIFALVQAAFMQDDGSIELFTVDAAGQVVSHTIDGLRPVKLPSRLLIACSIFAAYDIILCEATFPGDCDLFYLLFEKCFCLLVDNIRQLCPTCEGQCGSPQVPSGLRVWPR